MQRSKLWRVFQSLDGTERKNLLQFAASPYHNTRTDIQLIFEYLRDCVELEKKPTKAEAHQRAYGKDSPYHDVNLRLLLTYVYRLLLQFLQQEIYRKESTEASLYQLRAFRERDLSKEHASTSRTIEKMLDAAPLKNADWLHDHHQYETELFHYQSQRQATANFNLQKISDRLDEYYIAQKLREVCSMLIHQKMSRPAIDLGLFSTVQNRISEPRFQNIPAISVYYTLYLLLTEPEEEHHFEQLRNLLKQSLGLFSDIEQRTLILVATDYCSRKYHQGKKDYAREAFDLYRRGLESKVLLSKNTLSRSIYNNAIAFALLSKEYDWVTDTLHRHRHRLPEQYRDAVYMFNLARLRVETGEYDGALRAIRRVEYAKDSIHTLMARTVELKIYYHLQESDLLQSHLDAMKAYLRRKSVVGYHGKNFRNIIKYSQRLLKLNPNRKRDRNKLLQDIEAAEPLTEKKWLLARLASL